MKILQFAKDGTFIKEWGSSGEIEKELKIFRMNVSQCCDGNRKSAGGFLWRYA